MLQRSFFHFPFPANFGYPDVCWGSSSASAEDFYSLVLD